MFKRLSFAFIIGLISMSINAQDGQYEKKLTEYVQTLDTAKHISTFASLAYRFERMGQIKSQDWLPKYYAAYCKVRIAQRAKDAVEIEDLFKEGLKIIDTAEGICEDNSELKVLKGRIQLYLMGLDHMEFGPKYVGSAKALFTQSIELDPNNPRAYLMQGLYYLHMPGFLGGSRKKACEYLQKAQSVNAAVTPGAPYDPHWGGILIDHHLSNDCK